MIADRDIKQRLIGIANHIHTSLCGINTAQGDLRDELSMIYKMIEELDEQSDDNS